jgi:glycosyltransferase involved in cell wall biosynthesis
MRLAGPRNPSERQDRESRMTSGKPRISVGMPVYNGEPYIGIAIQSLLDQTFEDFELLISDNASTDRTEEICRDLAARDSRIVYTRNRQNIGAAPNYNRLVDMASADYFRWSNADDVFAPTLHERCIAVLDANPDAVLSYGKTKIIDADGNEGADYEDNLDLQDERPSDRFRKFHEQVGWTNAIYGLMRTEALSRTAMMGSGSFPAADTNLMGELVLYGKFIEVPECLFYRRIHAAASSEARADFDRQTSFWSAGAVKFDRPVWRKNAAYLRAVKRAPVDVDEKLRLAIYMLRRMYGAKRALLGELLGTLREKTHLVDSGSG